MKTTTPKSKRPTPADLRRLGELTGRTLTPAEEREHEALLSRFIDWGEFRDMGGAVYRDADGRKYAPATEGRARRVLRVRDWQQERDKKHFESILAAVESRGSIFARMGNLWLVAYGGRRAPLLENKKGMAYIHALLKCGTEGLTPRELCGMAHPLPPGAACTVEQDENTPTPGTDADRRSVDHADEAERRRWMNDPEIVAYVASRKEELRGAIADGDTEHAQNIRRELRAYGEGAPRGRRRPPDPVSETERTRVDKAIRRAIDEVKKHHRDAGAYLHEHLKPVSGRWRYTGKAFTT